MTLYQLQMKSGRFCHLFVAFNSDLPNIRPCSLNIFYIFEEHFIVFRKFGPYVLVCLFIRQDRIIKHDLYHLETKTYVAKTQSLASLLSYGITTLFVDAFGNLFLCFWLTYLALIWHVILIKLISFSMVHRPYKISHIGSIPQ